MMTCPACLANDVVASRRRGALEHGLLTWIGLFPFRCGHCQARFYKFAPKDPTRRGESGDLEWLSDGPHAARWPTRMEAVVTVVTPGEPSVVLKGTATKISADEAHLCLQETLPEAAQVSVVLEGTPARPGSVRWTWRQGEQGVLHGVQFHVPLERGRSHSRPLRRLRMRRLLRHAVIALLGLTGIAIAAYGVVWLIEGLRSYDPKYYEPKDIDREGHQLQRRLEELKRLQKP